MDTSLSTVDDSKISHALREAKQKQAAKHKPRTDASESELLLLSELTPLAHESVGLLADFQDQTERLQLEVKGKNELLGSVMDNLRMLTSNVTPLQAPSSALCTTPLLSLTTPVPESAWSQSSCLTVRHYEPFVDIPRSSHHRIIASSQD